MGDFERGQIEQATGRTSQQVLGDLLLTDKWEDDYNEFPEVKAAFEHLMQMLPGMVDGVLAQAKKSSVSNRALIKHLQEEGMQGHTVMVSDADIEQYVSPTKTDFRLDGVEEYMGMSISQAAIRAQRDETQAWRQEYEGTPSPPERCPAIEYQGGYTHGHCNKVASHQDDHVYDGGS